MKTKILAVLMLVAMLFTMTSCLSSLGLGPKPELDLDKAKKNLEKEEYIVNLVDDEDNLGVGEEEKLSAYHYSENNDDDRDFLYIVTYTDAKYAKLMYKEIKLEYDAQIEATELEIKTIEFILENYDSDLDSDEIDEYEDDLKDLEKELEEMKEEMVFGIKGSTIWYGTAKALEDSLD